MRLKHHRLHAGPAELSVAIVVGLTVIGLSGYQPFQLDGEIAAALNTFVMNLGDAPTRDRI